MNYDGTKKTVNNKSVNKGKSGERDFIRTIHRLTLGKVELQRNLKQSRDGGSDMDYKGFSIEVKRWKKVSDAMVRNWWKQCQGNASKHNMEPVLACRADQQGWRVFMHANNYFDIDDVRGCLSMDVELFARLLTDPKHTLPLQYGQGYAAPA